ncbi:hypothetical protein GQ43DRAFT_440677 [Delitschia confertaspora ATCC 74209]|uniref:Uncharacterized protein n=1 Tax=Delitschia confertaspora ATCC 74209 TaxID=1513339 RepID=A0A9P4JLM1_9PLEO|nr:hypothetical protein GQ43DRAFT_440677 [Delitschia confertaspora ATCC 74209]
MYCPILSEKKHKVQGGHRYRPVAPVLAIPFQSFQLVMTVAYFQMNTVERNAKRSMRRETRRWRARIYS